MVAFFFLLLLLSSCQNVRFLSSANLHYVKTLRIIDGADWLLFVVVVFLLREIIRIHIINYYLAFKQIKHTQKCNYNYSRMTSKRVRFPRINKYELEVFPLICFVIYYNNFCNVLFPLVAVGLEIKPRLYGTSLQQQPTYYL